MHVTLVRRLVVVLVALTLIAASCGGSSDDGGAINDDGASTTDNATATEAASDGADGDASSGDTANAGDSGADSDLSSKPGIDADWLGDYSSLVTTDLVVGDGDEAASGDQISMQYVGVLGSDGTEFDASWNRGTPFDFQLGAGQVISGWDEGIVGMRVGGRRVLQIPADMAYGSSPRGDVIGADADLLFVVDLIGIAPPAPTPVPPPPAPPIDAAFQGAFDALEITDLTEGSGRAAAEGDIAAVQYVGVVATDGTEFDSSWSRGAVPFRVIVGRGTVIDGWNEGLAGMKVGGERVLQIPSALAYGETGAGGAIGPDTDLIFRIHLEELIDAPLAHTLTFESPSPSSIETSTLVEGDGDSAAADATVEANLVVYFHNESQLVESTYTNGPVQPIDLAGPGFVPGVTEALAGIKAGEVRQVIIPAPLAFPEGIPPQAGLADDDALVFVVEAVAIS